MKHIAAGLLTTLLFTVYGCGGSQNSEEPKDSAGQERTSWECLQIEDTEIQEPEELTQEEIANEALFRSNTDGTPAAGWYTDADGTKGYCGEDGYLLTGFHDIEGARYLFLDNGDMVTGSYILDNGERILFTEDGRQYLQSVAPIDGEYYYFDANGMMVKDGEFSFPDGGWGMTDEEGKLYTGSHRFGDEVYTFTSFGKFRYKIDATKPMIALTYDDGPSTVHTQVILEALRANDAHATFFILGRNIERCSEIIQEIEDSDCEVANHTFNHYMIVNMDGPVTNQEISSTSSYVQMITNNRPSLFRPPTGATNDVSCANVAAVDNGYPIILWSLDTIDWQHNDAATTCERIRTMVKDGSIVLMHDMVSSTAEASKMIIPELIAAGYQLVTVSELAAARGFDLVPGQVYNHFYPEEVPAQTPEVISPEPPMQMPEAVIPPEPPAQTTGQPELPYEDAAGASDGELQYIFPWEM